MSSPFDWRVAAETVASLLPRNRLEPAAVEEIEASLRSGQSLALACSGGADSLALLLLIWGHWPEARARLTVLHFDHGLRGAESTGDCDFVKGVGAALGEMVRVGCWSREEAHAPSEEEARRARFGFFSKAMEESGARLLLLGHHRDDILESQLMRLSRGSGAAGLAAPRPVHRLPGDRINARPLLSVGGEEVRATLRAVGASWREDGSNQGRAYYRNRLRLDVIPLWQGHAPFDVRAGAAATRALLEDDDDALHQWLRELLPAPSRGDAFDLTPLRQRPRALLRRAVQGFLAAEEMGGAFSKSAFEGLLAAVEGGESAKISAGSGRFLALASGILRVINEEAPGGRWNGEWSLPEGSTMFFPGGRSLRVERAWLSENERSEVLAGRLPASMAIVRGEINRLSVRCRRPGDRFRPLGAPGSRKLQDIFVDRKVCEAERDLLPVVVSNEEIVWVPGVPPAEKAKILSDTIEVVRLTYEWGKTV